MPNLINYILDIRERLKSVRKFLNEVIEFSKQYLIPLSLFPWI